MRIVRWAASERVDIPDLTAMSYLVLGEFRRTMRSLVAGSANYIIQGFRVEPESPATTRIRVRLAPPGEDRGIALGAEETILGIDYGQLVGDRDSSFLAEGAAQQFIDFAGQPVGSYTLELQFTYTDGESDNRAFWNAGTGVEYVQITDTRVVSGWQIRRVAGAPTGGQWIPLATIAWDNVAVDAGDITDIRSFLFEGSAPFTRATQEASGGVEDFSRSTARGTFGVGKNKIREQIRALQRQVQDLKGPADDGTWSWFARPYRAYDPASARNAQLTKNLRSIDTVTYTIGDGVTSFGDFNGASGLNACLAHIAAMDPTVVPERIEIALHGAPSGSPAGSGYLLSGQKLLAGGSGVPLCLVIRAATIPNQTNATFFGRPTITVDGDSLSSNEYALIVTSGLARAGHLVLQDVDVLWTGSTASGRGMFAASGYVHATNCILAMSNSGSNPATDAGYVISSSYANRSRLRNCQIYGRVQFYDYDSPATTPPETEGGVIENCRFYSAHLRLVADTISGGVRPLTNGFTVKNSYFTGRTSAPYATSVAMIDARSSKHLTFEDCVFSYGVGENCIDGRSFASTTPYFWTIRRCKFATGTANGTHASDAGQHLADGTGWAISINQGREMVFEDNEFNIVSTDAGGVRLRLVNSYKIRGSSFLFCGHTSGTSDSFTGIYVSGTGAAVADRSKYGVISGCTFSEWVAGTTKATCILPVYSDALRIESCHFYGLASDLSTQINLASGYSVIRPSQTLHTTIQNCIFRQWNYNTGNIDRVIFCQNIVSYLTVRGCNFFNCGGTPIRITVSASQIVIDGNQLISTGTADDGFLIQATPADQVSFTNNVIQFTTAPPNRIGILIDADNYLVMGNNVVGGTITLLGSHTGRGYNETGQDLNLVAAYT